MIRKTILILILFIAFSNARTISAEPDTAGHVELVFFYETGCPKCARIDAFLNERIVPNYPVEIVKLEIHELNHANIMLRLAEIYQSDEIIKDGTPAVFIGEQAFQGDNRLTQRHIEQAVRKAVRTRPPSPFDKLPDDIRQVSMSRQLTLSAVIGAAAVDAINPCACAVLVLLLGTILVSSKRKRSHILGAGFAFTAACFISYFLLGLGLFSVIRIAGIERFIYIFVAALALLIGLWNIKDYFWLGRWFSIEVPKSWRPTVKRITTNITSIPGAFGSGIVVSLLLLPCTSGPYVVIIGMLSNTSTRWEAVGYLLLYNLIFVLPFVLITLGVGLGFTTTARVEAWRQKKLGKMHFITGLIMLALGLIMLGMVMFGFI